MSPTKLPKPPKVTKPLFSPISDIEGLRLQAVQVVQAMDLDGDGVIDGKDAQIALEIAKKQAAEYLAMAESEGFFSHFAAYNEQILRPLKNAGEFSTEGAKKEILATLMLQPRDLRNGFVLYNVLAFLFGVAEAFTSMALGHGPWSLIWNGGAGYCIAYTLYWIFLCKQAKVCASSIAPCVDASRALPVPPACMRILFVLRSAAEVLDRSSAYAGALLLRSLLPRAIHPVQRLHVLLELHQLQVDRFDAVRLQGFHRRAPGHVRVRHLQVPRRRGSFPDVLSPSSPGGAFPVRLVCFLKGRGPPEPRPGARALSTSQSQT